MCSSAARRLLMTRLGVSSSVEGFLAVVALVGLSVVWYLIRRGLHRGIAAGVSSARRATAIRQGPALSGQNAVYTRIVFSVPTSASELFDRIEFTMAAPTEPPALLAGLYRAKRTDQDLTYVSGSRSKQALIYVIVVTHSDARGCSGIAKAARWNETEGVVSVSDAISRLHKHVVSAVDALNGSRELTQNTTTQRA